MLCWYYKLIPIDIKIFVEKLDEKRVEFRRKQSQIECDESTVSSSISSINDNNNHYSIFDSLVQNNTQQGKMKVLQ